MTHRISPPLAPKPRALPSHLTNGGSPLHNSQTLRDSTERENLYASIKASNGPGRQPIDFKLPASKNQVNPTPFEINSMNGRSEDKDKEAIVQKHARDPRDEAPNTPPLNGTSRPASPFTANPTVDFDGLSWPSLGTKERLEATPEQAQQRLEKLSAAVKTILECVGEDPEREGLHKTPERYAKAMMSFTEGYEKNLRDIVNEAVFHEDHDELIIVKDIEVFSLCEHHLVPFTGKMHIGYIPNQRVLGLSKLARIAEMFSRRLQLQERLTKQVALAISEVLKPRGVAVVMESSHLCMVMRGVGKTSSMTVTSCMLGCMRSNAKTRDEFLRLCGK